MNQQHRPFFQAVTSKANELQRSFQRAFRPCGRIAATCAVLLFSFAALAGESTNELKTVRVTMKCDTPKCTGEMQFMGTVLTSNPPQYPHQCPVCKTNRTFWVLYPEIRYENK